MSAPATPNPPGPSGTDAAQTAVEDALVERVVASFDNCADPRLQQILVALTRHLHGFLREVRLTEAEWGEAIAFLTRAGHITDDVRQEFILLSDTLGASMQTININNATHGGATEATVFGPFFVEDAPQVDVGGDIAFGAPGEPCWVEGSVTDTDGRPVPGARIEVWEADDDGLYDVQRDPGARSARGRLVSDDAGEYRFWALTPTPYPIPHDGPVGQLLAAAGRSPLRAAHLHFMVSHPGSRTLVTHIFPSGDPVGDQDAVFGVKDSLIKTFAPQAAGTPTPDGRAVDGTWTRVRFDIVLAPEGT